MGSLTGIVRLLKKEQNRLTTELQGISAALAAFGRAYSGGTGARKLSASGRARIAAAQRARWAKARGKAGATTKATPKAKRTLSAAARRKIAAAQRARWAKLKSTKKSN